MQITGLDEFSIDAGATSTTPPQRSCAAGLECGSGATAGSCCDRIEVPGGTFPMGRSDGGADDREDESAGVDEQPEHQVSVSSYWLDRFEVTVGRFRAFVAAYDADGKPTAGAGRHPRIADSGWRASWDGELPASSALLTASFTDWDDDQVPDDDCKWSDEPSGGETHPVNCVPWHVAFAFCAWDGGRLPTEAEWEYAAAGAADNRLMPWGAEWPTAGSGRANWGSLVNDTQPVGSYPTGAGRWRHLDLGGNVAEWTLDVLSASWYAGGGSTCDDCANLQPDTGDRVLRGGAWMNGEGYLRAASRETTQFGAPRHPGHGIRCAYDSPLQ